MGDGNFLLTSDTYNSSSFDDNVYNNGLMCRTKEQAEELRKLLIETAQKFQGFE